MFPKSHVIFGFLFSLLLIIIFPKIGIWGFEIIFISSVLIDFDHYLFYVWLKKDWSLKNAYNWFVKGYHEFVKLPKNKRKQKQAEPVIFHGIEAIVILIILSFISKYALFILIGFLFHQFLDLIDILKIHSNINHVISQTKNILTYKRG